MPASTWIRHYDYVHAFVRLHQRLPVTHDYAVDIDLGKWCASQRSLYNTNQLDHEKIIMLEAIPKWKWKKSTKTWLERYHDLVRFVADHQKLPSYSKESQEEKSLCNWVKTQKSKHQLNRLTGEQISKLQEINGWSWSKKTLKWEDRLELLKSQNIDQKMKDWIKRQKQLYHKGQLAQNRIDQLNQIPEWTWKCDHPCHHQWDTMFQSLVNFLHQTPFMPTTREDPELSKWLSTQRRKYTDGTLDLAKQEQLENIPNWTWAPPSRGVKRPYSFGDKIIFKRRRSTI